MFLTPFLPCQPLNPTGGTRAPCKMPPWPPCGQGTGAVLGGHQMLPTALAGHTASVRGGTDAQLITPLGPASPTQLLPSLATAPPSSPPPSPGAVQHCQGTRG